MTLECKLNENWLIQPLLPLKIAKRSYIRQSKSEAILILVAHRSQRKAPVFQAQPATIPGITRLHRRKLQRPQICVETKAGSGAQAGLVELSVTQQHAKLMIIGGRRQWLSHERVNHPQESIAAPNRKRAIVVVDQRQARIDPSSLEVVIQIPLGVGARTGFNTQPRNDGRKTPLRIKKRGTRKIRRRRKYIPLPRHQRVPKRGIKEIFLPNFPT